jgi:hypothetical protein
MLTKQHILDKVYDHFITEGKPRGYNPVVGRCVYRGSCGWGQDVCECAVGIFLPPGHPGHNHPGSAMDLLRNFPDLNEAIINDGPFLQSIQALHDRKIHGLSSAGPLSPKEVFAEDLSNFARDQGFLDPARWDNPVRLEREKAEAWHEAFGRWQAPQERKPEELVIKIDVQGATATANVMSPIYLKPAEIEALVDAQKMRSDIDAAFVAQGLRSIEEIERTNRIVKEAMEIWTGEAGLPVEDFNAFARGALPPEVYKEHLDKMDEAIRRIRERRAGGMAALFSHLAGRSRTKKKELAPKVSLRTVGCMTKDLAQDAWASWTGVTTLTRAAISCLVGVLGTLIVLWWKGLL